MHTTPCLTDITREWMSMQQTGYGPSPLTAGASNPNLIRNQIAQDLGYYGQAGQAQTPWTQSTQQQIPSGASYGTFSQFGTNPQLVQQQIAQDLQQQQQFGSQQTGYLTSQAMTSRQSYGQPQGYQPAQNQAYYNPAVYSQVMNSVPNESQWIRQQIAEDIQAGQQHQWQQPQAMTRGTGQTMQGMHKYQPAQSQSWGTNSTLSQFGTSPQMVQSHIQSDLSQGQPMQPHFQGQSQQFGQSPYGTSPMSQYGTNPAVVRQHIQNDLSSTRGSYYYS